MNLWHGILQLLAASGIVLGLMGATAGCQLFMDAMRPIPPSWGEFGRELARAEGRRPPGEFLASWDDGCGSGLTIDMYGTTAAWFGNALKDLRAAETAREIAATDEEIERAEAAMDDARKRAGALLAKARGMYGIHQPATAGPEPWCPGLDRNGGVS